MNIMAKNLSTVKVSGTSTEKTNFESTLTTADAGLQFTTSGGPTYTWNGSSFNQIATAGAAHITPDTGTKITGASGNVAAAIATATLAAVAGKTTYITGFAVTGAGATAGLPVIVAVTGTITGTLSFIAVAAVGALVANQPLVVTFPTPVPASAANTAIVVTVPSLGVGNTHSAAVAYGFQL